MKIINSVKEIRKSTIDYIKQIVKGYDTKKLNIYIFSFSTGYYSGECTFSDDTEVLFVDWKPHKIKCPSVCIKINPLKKYPHKIKEEREEWKDYVFKNLQETFKLVFLHEFKHYIDLCYEINDKKWNQERYADEWAILKYMGIDIIRPYLSKGGRIKNEEE